MTGRQTLHTRPTVHMFFRKGKSGENYSIEKLFDVIGCSLESEGFVIRKLYAPVYSRGLLNRILIIFWAALNQGDVNHFTGDINFACLLTRKRKTLVTIHDCRPMWRLKSAKRLIYLAFWIAAPILRAKVVATISEFSKAEINKFVRIGNSRIRVISNCLTLGTGISSENDDIIDTVKPIVLQIGTKENKNLKNLIPALQGIDCHLVVIGPLSELDAILMAECGVEYTNLIAVSEGQLIALYRRSAMLAFISIYEGFGLPILEAQAMGTPVITSDLEPLKTVAGSGALLVNPYDVSGIKTAITQVLCYDERRLQLIKAGYENSAKYSPLRSAREYAAVYREIMLL